MKTKIFSLEKDSINHIINYSSKIIKKGGLVVFPTETVYGIGANALDKDAAQNIYKVKGRPSDNPLIVHIGKYDDIYKYARQVSEDAMKLVRTYWPGPLTLVLPKNAIVPDEITGGLDTVAIRYPNNLIAEGIILESDLPICAPSANISGTPSSTTFDHVYQDLNGKVDVIIDGGKSNVGLESTVLDMTNDIPTILRPGAITKKMIEKTLGKKINAPKIDLEDDSIPKAPGMKYKHYAPKGKVTILQGSHDKISHFLANAEEKDMGLIASTELCNLVSDIYTFDLGPVKDTEAIGKNIFLALRTMDLKNISNIYVEAFQDDELGQAIMNRLLKAANQRVIKL
jgi:L-threonylcarbamoyladenylate synthase